MKLRKLIVAFAATAATLGGMTVAAAPASANHKAPNVCVFAGTVTLNPGVNPVPPSTPGGYDFDSVAIVCVGGAGTPFIGTVDSSGTYAGDGSFSGNLDVSGGSDCDGSVSGTRLGAVLVATATTAHCGSGPVVAVFVPTSGPVITSAVIVGAAVLI